MPNQNNKEKKVEYVFFGTSSFAVVILDEFEKAGFTPSLVVTTEDKPQGRKLLITPPPVKVWANQRNIPVLQPQKLKDSLFIRELQKQSWDVFIVAAYGKIIPQEVISIPRRHVLNVHPSLLPKLRGATPLQTSILEEDETGVTIMRIDELMDHGPIIAQKKLTISEWPIDVEKLEKLQGEEGGKLLAQTLPAWIEGSVTEIPQDHNKATYTKKITKADGFINLDDDPVRNYRKIQAYKGWPTAYFFAKKDGKDIRVIIRQASLREGVLEITRVIPEGKKEVNYKDFLKSIE